jgi:gamma-glutamylcyclotransferase
MTLAIRALRAAGVSFEPHNGMEMTLDGNGPMTSALYFAYGSNLDEAQMRSRCPSARKQSRATLRGYALAFGGFSRHWGGAVATVLAATDAEVHGVLYELSHDDLRVLDRSEGHPISYQRVLRAVVDEAGQCPSAYLYVQPEEGFEVRAPAPEYLEAIRRAYVRLGFDTEQLMRAGADWAP